MKIFLYRFVSTLFLSAIILETVLRVFQLAGSTLPEVNHDGNRMLKPGIEGTWIKGGLGEVKSHYSINSQGWNSIIDFDEIDPLKTSIALIGDSYIQGLHVDVENSIGRLLESDSSDYFVHEYGRDGANIADFLMVYEAWVKGNYEYTFILVSNRNLNEFQPSFMNQGLSIPSESILRRVYNASYLIRYLNINHGLLLKINSLFRDGPVFLQNSDSDSCIDLELVAGQVTIEEIFMGFDSTVVFVYQLGTVDTSLIENHRHLKVNHQVFPISYGFDGHWNLNGRINCANSIHTYIQSPMH